ncbi:MAG: HupE/UreJ family protein [Pseudanabaenaceae cyanobacterium bins.39]|nr:HupE/UreJ family protein [Pseudanabaenaceae cyanobacterium bins.39]
MNILNNLRSNLKSNLKDLAIAPFQFIAIFLLLGISMLSLAHPAEAHHAMGGKIPTNIFEGIVTGLAHPVIGFDHLAFVVAVGLLATTIAQGIWIPIAFVLSAMIGTGLHLVNISLPLVELIVSASVLLFGVLLALQKHLNRSVIMILAAIAGLFHGYAYGEAIFGAQSQALIAYLTGFTIMQLLISSIAFVVGKKLMKGNSQPAGLVVCGIGAALVVAQLSKLAFPNL